MIKTLHIDKIYFSAQSKDGKAYISKKNGQPFKKVDIYSQGLPDGAKSIGGFAFQDSPILEWKDGDTITVEIISRQYNGKTYLDFKQVSEGMIELMKLKQFVYNMADFTGYSQFLQTPVKKGKSEEQKIADDMANIKGEDYKLEDPGLGELPF